MELLELDTAIDELETRVERLRSLYEQYFMGIEKIAPAVAHKDVTRRIEILRREQIRNTAKRFRLQMIIQRYNTFHQYWLRILREIENGTYKRHLLRVERSMNSKSVSNVPGPRVSSAPPETDVTLEGDVHASSRPRKSIAPSAPRHPIPVNTRQSSLPPPDKVEAFTRALERDLAAALDGDLDFGSSKHSEYDEHSLELDEPLLKPLGPLPVKTVVAAKPAPSVPEASRTAVPLGRLRLPAQSAVGGHRLPPPQTKTAAKPEVARPQVAAAPPKPEVARPRVAATPPKPEVAQPRAATAPNTGLTADRVRQLHRELIQAKQETNDAGAVSLGSLTRKLAITSKQLSQKHSGKKIDFMVVIKDGKALVKPIVK